MTCPASAIGYRCGSLKTANPCFLSGDCTVVPARLQSRNKIAPGAMDKFSSTETRESRGFGPVEIDLKAKPQLRRFRPALNSEGTGNSCGPPVVILVKTAEALAAPY